MRPGHSAFVLGCALALPGGVGAQVAGHVDAGSGTMHTSTESPFGIVRLAPSLAVRTSHFQLNTEADFAGHTEHGWQSNSRLTALVRLPLVGSLEALLRLDAGASRTRFGRGAGGWLGGGRLQLGAPDRGLALGWGSGNSFTAGGSQPLSRIEAGGWSRLGRLDIGLWLKRTGLSVPGMTQDDRTPVDTLHAGEGTRRITVRDHYTDVEATIGWARGNLALEAGAGRRFGSAFRFTSWHVRATYQMTSRVALVGMSGQFPVDLVSGLPSGGFTTLSLRFNLKDETAPSSGHRPSFRREHASFSASAVEEGLYLIAVRVPQAQAVELMGDFTNWVPVLLVPSDDDFWHLRMPVPAGPHEVNLRVNGGPWTVPPGLSTRDDGLGGQVGVFWVH